MKNSKELYENHKYSLYVAIWIILLILLIIFIPTDNVYENSVSEVEYEEMFDLSKVPSGMIIWRHGVPDKKMDFIHTDSTLRYEYFDVGILSINQEVYKVRVPYYAIGLFPLGNTVNLNKPEPKRNPKKPKHKLYIPHNNLRI